MFAQTKEKNRKKQSCFKASSRILIRNVYFGILKKFKKILKFIQNQENKMRKNEKKEINLG